MSFKIDWASLIVGSKFTVLFFFNFAFEGSFSKYRPGGLYLEGRFNGGYFSLLLWGGLYLDGLIPGGAYFRNFTVWCKKGQKSRKSKTMVILHLHTSLHTKYELFHILHISLHGVAYLRANAVFTIFALDFILFCTFLAPY